MHHRTDHMPLPANAPAPGASGTGPLWAGDPAARARAVLARRAVSAAEWRRVVEELLPEVERAWHCPITGLWTRDAWMRLATQMIEDDHGALIIFLDLDGFKAVNDSYGHDAGDAVLAAVGARLATWCEHAGGIPAHLAGDEFVAVIPREHWLAASKTVLREELTVPLDREGTRLAFGASLGVAAVVAHPGETAAEHLSWAMRRADKAMYEDKAARHGGRVTDRRGRLVTADIVR